MTQNPLSSDPDGGTGVGPTCVGIECLAIFAENPLLTVSEVRFVNRQIDDVAADYVRASFRLGRHFSVRQGVVKCSHFLG